MVKMLILMAQRVYGFAFLHNSTLHCIKY